MLFFLYLSVVQILHPLQSCSHDCNPRSHPRKCSGSGLGRYILPPKPAGDMEYTPAKSVELDHDVSIEEVEEYFANYIVNDSLGIIANAHTVFAEREPSRAWCHPCFELAKLFFVAVHLPRTPAGILSLCERISRVHGKLEKPSCDSTAVIGKLYKQVKHAESCAYYNRSFNREVAKQSYDCDMEVQDFEGYVEDAFYHKSNYRYKLGNLMDYYGIKIETEILNGNIMRASKSVTETKRCGSNQCGSEI